MLATRPAAVSVPSTVATGRTGGCCAQGGDARVTRRAGHHDAPGDGGQAGDESGEHRLLDLLAGDDEHERGEVRLAVGDRHQAGALQAGAERGHPGGVHGLGPLRRADRVADELADPVVRRGVGADDVGTELLDELETQGVDEGLLAGVDQAAAEGVGRDDLRPGRLDLGGERLDVLGVGTGQRDDGDGVPVQPVGVQPGCDARGERVGVRRPRLVLRVGGRLRGWGGGLATGSGRCR